MSYGNVYNRVLQPTLERCGLDGQRVGFHSFRRFCGSMLTEEMGRSITQVSEYLGHADKATTFGSSLSGATLGPLGPPEKPPKSRSPQQTIRPETAD